MRLIYAREIPIKTNRVVKLNRLFSLTDGQVYDGVSLQTDIIEQ